ncbi:MAG: Hsp70 family protein [Clostridia bacterium]|nr:Hsp70 family protein [Clostridia bacterium]
MNKYYGFDLGDAESAVSRLDRKDVGMPEVLAVREARSFVTAYAQLSSGELLVGESACYNTDAIHRSLRFKSLFLTDPQSERDIRRFAAAVLGELYGDGNLVKGEDCCFYIGCPAGWGLADRERYRRIFEDVGYPPARIVSESRAALISACQSKHFQVGYDIMSRPVLVVDIGSSTTDFAFILAGKEVELQTAGEVRLGGGILDELLLEESIRRSERAEAVRKALEASPPWRSYCEFAARRLKEQYFSDEDYWRENDCQKTIRILTQGNVKLTLRMNGDIAERLLNRGARQLNGRSFKEAFTDSLRQVRERLKEHPPELLFLTGGVSKLPAIRTWCAEAFPDAVVITGAEPEFSVCRGLAWSGRIDDELRQFRQEVAELVASSAVEQIVERRIDDLYHRVADAMVEPILRQVALPVFDRWRRGDIARLSEIDDIVQREIESWLHSDEAQALLVRPISEWLKPVAYDIEEKTMPICVRHNVPYRSMSLNSYFSLSDIDIRIDAREVFAVEGFTWLINAIISIIVGLICGGSGLAVISSGVSGILAGAILSLLILFIGKDRMQKLFMNMDVPVPMRKLVPRGHFEARIDRMTEEIKDSFYSSLENNRNTEITKRLTTEITQQIEQCLTQMAEVVEIPL